MHAPSGDWSTKKEKVLLSDHCSTFKPPFNVFKFQIWHEQMNHRSKMKNKFFEMAKPRSNIPCMSQKKEMECYNTHLAGQYFLFLCRSLLFPSWIKCPTCPPRKGGRQWGHLIQQRSNLRSHTDNNPNEKYWRNMGPLAGKQRTCTLVLKFGTQWLN